MLKSLHKDDTQITPFIATKNWELSNVTNEDLILMEHSGSDGLPVAIEYLEYGVYTPHTASGCNLALERQALDLVTFRDGLKLSGIFYPETDPQNQDGTYKRVVYSQVLQMFYNNYRDPTKMWGMEEIDFDKSETLKFVSDQFKLFQIPQAIFGEKVLENTVQLFDATTDNDYVIKDDGHCNLFAGTNLFSHQQEVGEYLNDFLTGSSDNCDVYNTISPPDQPILSAFVNSCIPVVDLFWNINGWPVTAYTVERSDDSGSTWPVSQSLAGFINSYFDVTVLAGSTYWYRVYATNLLGNSPYSLVITASVDGIYWDTDSDIWDLAGASCGPTYWDSASVTPAPPTCSRSPFPSQYFTESLKNWMNYDLVMPAPPPPMAPVSLIVSSGSAILTWNSASNENLTSFGIQRSLTGTSYSNYAHVIPISSGGEAVTNGGFEAGVFSPWVMNDPSAGSSVETFGWASSYIHSGNYAAVVGPYNGNTGSLSQVLTTGNGNTYTLSFWLLSNTGGTMFQVYWEGNLVADLSAANAPYTQYSYSVTATGATSLLEFRMQNEPSYYGLDDVSVSAGGGPSYLPETYTDTSVSAGNTYWYQVASVNVYGTSSFSNTASISFIGAPLAPISPNVSSGSGQAVVTWVSQSNDQDYFDIRRSTDGVTYNDYATVGPTLETYSDTGVSQGNTYYYQIGAVNAYGTSSFTSPVSINFPGAFSCGATPTNMNETSWSKVTFMGSPPCADFVWNSGSSAASWYWKRDQFDSPCSSWVDVSTTICNPGAAYDITVTIPWTATGNVFGGPPYQASFALDINGSVVHNEVGDMATDLPQPIVLSGSIPATQTSTVRLYFASGGTLAGAGGYTIASTSDLTITPATHP